MPHKCQSLRLGEKVPVSPDISYFPTGWRIRIAQPLWVALTWPWEARCLKGVYLKKYNCTINFNRGVLIRGTVEGSKQDKTSRSRSLSCNFRLDLQSPKRCVRLHQFQTNVPRF